MIPRVAGCRSQPGPFDSGESRGPRVNPCMQQGEVRNQVNELVLVGTPVGDLRRGLVDHLAAQYATLTQIAIVQHAVDEDGLVPWEERTALLVRLASQLEEAAKVFTGWMAAEAEAAGVPIGQIAKAAGQFDTSSLRRKYPDMRRFRDARTAADLTGQPIRVDAGKNGEWPITIQPIGHQGRRPGPLAAQG